jgi:1-hydroxy-2-naphthoate dioxygenase
MSTVIKTLEEFDHDLAAMNIRGQWKFDDALEASKSGPRNGGVPFIWKWSDVGAKLVEACSVMPESFTARRNFSFINPGLPKPGTTQTILMGMQMVMPGEVAWAHRHTIGALRFTIEGDEHAYTVVDGEVLPMERGDLVLTPSWTWHDHHNESAHNAIWLDVLDVPTVFSLNQTFYESFGESTQPIREERGDYLGERARNVRPAWEVRPNRPVPLRYAWRDVEPILENYARTAGNRPDGVVLEYVNPITGGPTLPTLTCYIQLLPKGFETRERQQSSSSVFYVHEGHGQTIVNGETLTWGPRDAFVIPTWATYKHVNGSGAERAVLFSVSDEPLVKALGLYREAGTVAPLNPLPLVPGDRGRR